MGRKPRPHLLAYDIADPKRLKKIHKVMTAWGLPVQFSVFALDLTDRAADRLFAQLGRIADPDTDDIRLYRLPETPITRLGRPPLPEGVILTGAPSSVIISDDFGDDAGD